MAKKIQRYVPSVKIPADNQQWRVLFGAGHTFSSIMGLLEKVYDSIRASAPDRENHWLPYQDVHARWKRGEITDTNYEKELYNQTIKMMCAQVWRISDEYKRLNDAFFVEYNSREDLQEIYKECAASCHWFYDSEGNCMNHEVANGKGCFDRPLSVSMWQQVVGAYGTKKIELARETPYKEGDLVLLRKIGIDREEDPFHINRWSQEYRDGKRTPDESVQRIGTVIAHTDKTRSWRSGKGSKMIKVLWMGTDQPKNIQEKYLKWHERPTYRNGMKVRE